MPFKNPNEKRQWKQHWRKNTISGFLSDTYDHMKRRVAGKGKSSTRHLYSGKALLPRNKFVLWAQEHPTFLMLFKRWVKSGYQLRLRPTVHRINSAKGYTLDNVEWLAYGRNSGLASVERVINNKKSVYRLLGIVK